MVACCHGYCTSQCSDLAQLAPTSKGLSISPYVQRLTLHWITLSTLLMMAHKAETAVQGWSVDHTCQPSRSRRDSPALETKTRRPARRPKKADSSRFVPINAQNHDFKPAFACSLCSSVGIQVSSVFWPFLMHPSVAGSFVRSYLYGICAYACKLCPSAFAGRVRHATVQVYHFRPWAVGRGRCLS